MNSRKLLMIVMALVALTACGGGSPTGPSTFPVVIITNTWNDESDGNHQFALVSDDDGEMSGTFSGTELTPDFQEFALVGSWGQGRISFTVDRDPDATYSGVYTTDNPTRLEFTSAVGALVLVQSN